MLLDILAVPAGHFSHEGLARLQGDIHSPAHLVGEVFVVLVSPVLDCHLFSLGLLLFVLIEQRPSLLGRVLRFNFALVGCKHAAHIRLSVAGVQVGKRHGVLV